MCLPINVSTCAFLCLNLTSRGWFCSALEWCLYRRPLLINISGRLKAVESLAEDRDKKQSFQSKTFQDGGQKKMAFRASEQSFIFILRRQFKLKVLCFELKQKSFLAELGFVLWWIREELKCIKLNNTVLQSDWTEKRWARRMRTRTSSRKTSLQLFIAVAVGLAASWDSWIGTIALSSNEWEKGVNVSFPRK